MTSRKRTMTRGVFSSVSIADDVLGCSHGPKLRFVKREDGAAIYRCSAFRNATACAHDLKETQVIASRTLHIEEFIKHKREDRFYCHSCRALFSQSSEGEHKNHHITNGITISMLNMPSYLLEPLEESSEHAQYFFSHDWLNFMIAVLRALRIENVLCVGAPRLFDFLTALRHKNLSIPHFLLDLDCRLEMFYSPSSFARFSVLNGHFFSSEGEVCANAFMKSCQGRSLIFCDPPFGAFMQPLVESLKKLKDGILYSGEGREVFLMITVPYFIGKKLIQAAPELKMLDYKCSGLDENDAKRRVSVVRTFTDAPPGEISPPRGLEKTFWYCNQCQRYSDVKNRHCNACGFCSTLHGETYNHCSHCQKCRPPSYTHCDACNRCHKEQECDKNSGLLNQKRKRRM